MDLKKKKQLKNFTFLSKVSLAIFIHLYQTFIQIYPPLSSYLTLIKPNFIFIYLIKYERFISSKFSRSHLYSLSSSYCILTNTLQTVNNNTNMFYTQTNNIHQSLNTEISIKNEIPVITTIRSSFLLILEATFLSIRRCSTLRCLSTYNFFCELGKYILHDQPNLIEQPIQNPHNLLINPAWLTYLLLICSISSPWLDRPLLKYNYLISFLRYQYQCLGRQIAWIHK